jgi:hypothetical protein
VADSFQAKNKPPKVLPNTHPQQSAEYLSHSVSAVKGFLKKRRAKGKEIKVDFEEEN